MANNIKLSYRYRDGANYKNHHDVVFDNPDNVSLEVVDALIRSKLIDETFFYNHEFLLPDLHFGTWDNTIDHTWHEYIGLSHTDEPVNIGVDLKQFMAAVTQCSGR